MFRSHYPLSRSIWGRGCWGMCVKRARRAHNEEPLALAKLINLQLQTSYKYFQIWIKPTEKHSWGSAGSTPRCHGLPTAHKKEQLKPRIATKGSTKQLQRPGSRGQLFTGNSCSCFLCSFELKFTALAKLCLAPRYFTSGASTISLHKCQGTRDQRSQFMLPGLAQA